MAIAAISSFQRGTTAVSPRCVVCGHSIVEGVVLYVPDPYCTDVIRTYVPVHRTCDPVSRDAWKKVTAGGN